MNKQNRIILALIIFCAGFLSGVGFSVWRLEFLVSDTLQAEKTTSTQTTENQITALLQKVKKTPEDGNAWARLGNLYYDTQQPEKAIDAYLHSLDLQPASPDLLTDLGVMYRRINQPEQALYYFNEAASRNSTHLPSRFNKGVVLLNDLERPLAAIAAWKEILVIDPDATTGNGRRVADIIAEVKQNYTEEGKNK